MLTLQEKLEAEKEAREELLTKYGDSLKELETTREQVQVTQALHSDAQDRLGEVSKQLAAVNEDYKQLSEKSKAVSTCGIIHNKNVENIIIILFIIMSAVQNAICLLLLLLFVIM